MAHKLFLFNFLILAFFFATCNSLEPPPPEKAITLTLEDVSCTEAWINLTTTNLQLPTNITLKQNNTVTQDIGLSNADTLLYIDSLLPKTTYTFQAFIHSSNQSFESNEMSLVTMDTTSHNFTWQTFTFGEPSAGSSVLNDVAIIDENNIWAVGEIYMNDSTGQPDPLPYNAVHWDGVRWSITRIPTKTFTGTTVSSEIRTIFSFNENDFWTFSMAGSYSHWNGNIWITEFVNERDGSGNKLWGASSSDIYLASNNGGISNFNGVRWKRIESGTDLPINDIWGVNISSEIKILAVASNIYQFQDKKILSISSDKVVELSTIGLPLSLATIWFNNIYKSYIGGDGLYYSYSQSNDWERIELPLYYIYSIRGNGLNDIIICGGYGYVCHFNGISWMNYLGSGLDQIAGNYYSVSMKGNKICAVGIADGKAVAVIGTR